MKSLLLSLFILVSLTSCAKTEKEDPLYSEIPNTDLGGSQIEDESESLLPDEVIEELTQEGPAQEDPPNEEVSQEEDISDSDTGEESDFTYCRYTLKRDSYWQGYNVNVKIEVLIEDIDAWEVQINAPKGQVLNHYWNIELTQELPSIIGNGFNYNSEVSAGESFNFGLQFSHDDIEDERNIEIIKLNGHECQEKKVIEKGKKSK